MRPLVTSLGQPVARDVTMQRLQSKVLCSATALVKQLSQLRAGDVEAQTLIQRQRQRFHGNQRPLLPPVQDVDVAVVDPESRVGPLDEGIPQCPHQGMLGRKPNRADLGLALGELGEVGWIHPDRTEDSIGT